MASFRIREDQENIRGLETRRFGKEIQQSKRNALEPIENKRKNAVFATKNIKSEQNVILKKINDENQAPKQLKAKQQEPAIPVAQFEAFTVYEDEKDEKKATQKITETVNTKAVAEKILSERDPKATELSLSEAALKLILKEVPKPALKQIVVATPMSECSIHNESPMSVDRSLSAIVSKENKVKQLRDRDVLFHCVDYRDDIYKYMRECEVNHRSKPGYMKKQPDITYSMRTILVDWLVEVAEEYKLHSETLFLAVSYIDRFLSYMSVVRAKLQLVGTAAMFIAAKYEEIYPPDVGEFVYITDDTYTKKQVLRMEQLILRVLSFDLSAPTSLTFVKDFCIAKNIDDKTMFLAMYLIELSLLDAELYLQYLPSHLAYSAIALARYNFDDEPWIEEYEHSSGYTLEHLRPCIKNLHRTFVSASTSQQQTIQEKYKSPKYQHVSMILPKEPRPDFIVVEEENSTGSH